jgi:hypothetical protein
MGRYLKNTQLEGGSYAIQIPLGSSSIGPDSPVNGQMRFNQTTSKIEFYYNSAWNSVAKIGRVDIATDTFDTSDFISASGQLLMPNAPRDYSAGEEASVMVFIGGVQQRPIDHYTFAALPGSKFIYLNPTAIGDAGQTVLVIHNFNSTDAA